MSNSARWVWWSLFLSLYSMLLCTFSDAWRQSDSVLWNHSCPSACPSVRHKVLSRLDHYVFLIFYVMVPDHDIWYLVTAWHHPPWTMREGESDEESRIFCGHVNFPEMNGRISVYGGKSNNHKEGGIVIPNNTLQK